MNMKSYLFENRWFRSLTSLCLFLFAVSGCAVVGPKSAGYKVEVFESARAFLNWEYHQGENVLVLDVRMPGMNRLELQRLLADSGLAIPIIFISAHEDTRAREKAMAARAVAFLQKPFEDHTLLSAIHRVLGV